jgi:hypothetical protein
MPLEQLTLDRVTRVSRAKHVFHVPDGVDPTVKLWSNSAIKKLGANRLMVNLDGTDDWLEVRQGKGSLILAEWYSGSRRFCLNESASKLESMVECKACLEHGTGACQGEC